MRSALLLSLLAVAWCADADAGAGAGAAPLLTREELEKLRVPALKAMLSARGQACEGCAEKADFVALALATQALPTLAPPATPSAPPAPPPEDIDVEALMARFRRERGGGGARLQKIKARLARRGLDVSRLDLGGLAGFDSLDDATLEKLLEAMAGGGPPPAGGAAAADDDEDGGDGAPAARRPAAGGHSRAPPRAAAAAAVDGEEAAVVDDDGGEL